MTTKRLAQLVKASSRTVIFTGAGMSTESGIPDFRSPGGVWTKMKPIMFDDFVRSREVRRTAWERTFSGVAGWTGAKPNAGHMAVAKLILDGKAECVITQNVDNLHQESGVPGNRVIELHGNASYAKCLDCGLRHELADLRGPFESHGEIPMCRACGGIVKTATISFGQAMPALELRRAEEVSIESDLFLVLGSSLVVYPAAALPLLAKRAGALLAIVNREETDQDEFADLVIHEGIGEVMSAVVA